MANKYAGTQTEKNLMEAFYFGTNWSYLYLLIILSLGLSK